MVASQNAIYRQFGRYFEKYFRYEPLDIFRREDKCSCKHKKHVIHNVSKNFPLVYFVFDEKFLFLGSVVLRTFQTADLLQHSLNRPIQTISTKKLEVTKVQGAILVFSKTAIRSVSEELLESLHSANNILVADPIDLSVENIQNSFDASITTELNFDPSLVKNLVPTHHLSHAPDWRLHGIKADSIGTECLYLGNQKKDIFSESREENVQKIYTKDFSLRVNNVPKWSRELSMFSFHLTASKPAQVSVARPPTKLITALMLGATPIVGKWESGSIKILGNDFPYVLNSSDPTLAREQIPNLLNRELCSPTERQNLETKLEDLYCPVHHANEWNYLFIKMLS